MPRESLDFGPPEHAATEGIRFRLHGPGWEEWFTTVPQAPSGALSDLLRGIQYDEQRRAVYLAPNLIRFMVNVLREQATEWVVEVPEGAEVVTPDEAKARGLEVPEGPEAEGAQLVVVETDDVVRFFALTNDKRRPLPVEQLGACVKGISEAMGNRPTPPSAP